MPVPPMDEKQLDAYLEEVATKEAALRDIEATSGRRPDFGYLDGLGRGGSRRTVLAGLTTT